jgi:hypothetical protein
MRELLQSASISQGRGIGGEAKMKIWKIRLFTEGLTVMSRRKLKI